MPAIKVRIPYDDSDAYAGENLSQSVKQAVAELLEKMDKAPKPAPFSVDVPTKTVSIWLSDDQVTALEQARCRENLGSPAQACEALLHAMAIESRPAATLPTRELDGNTTLNVINHALGNTTRPAQEQFYRQIRDAIAGHPAPHKVLFAEAATGIGKTRPFIAVALDWHRDHPSDHIAISCPNYNVILQTLAQWNRVGAAMELPEYQVILGQQEYVSQQALERALAEAPETPSAEAAARWLKAGGPGTSDDPFKHRWLMRSFRAATNFEWGDAESIRVTSDCSEQDEGYLAYQRQFVDARETPIIFCTHAMLAVDVRRLTQRAAKAATTDGDSFDSDANFQRWLAGSQW